MTIKRILLTGATGFLGRHCLPLLSGNNAEVHAVSSKVPPGPGSDAKWHEADLLNSRQTCELVSHVQPTHLLHLAWYTVPGSLWDSLEHFRWVQASLTLLQAFAASGGQRVVMAGTCAEYDWDYGFCSEFRTPLSPRTVYGMCKHSLQQMVGAFTKHTSVNAAWGRIFFVYGPGEHPSKLVSSVIRTLLRGDPARCSHGNQIRDYLYVKDAAAALVRLLSSDVQGPVNIASGRPVLLRHIILTIAERLQRQDLVHLGAVSTPKDEPQLLVADVRRLLLEVGVQPEYELDRGLEDSIRWWDKQLLTGTRRDTWQK